MALVPMKQILDEADRGGYGVGAFNANNMEQIQAITRAARDVDSPVIIQASRGALRYTNLIYLKKLMEAWSRTTRASRLRSTSTTAMTST